MHILILWVITAIIFSYYRSFWGDELVRLVQSKKTLFDALESLFKEPSPFSAGEIVLNWVSNRTFGNFLPDEIWARLVGVLFGALTFHAISRLQKRNPTLEWLLYFSVSFLMVSVQMRPYAGLIYSGAVVLLLLSKEHFDKKDNFHFYFAIIFGHLYGICFVGFTAFLRKKMRIMALALLHVVITLYFFKKYGMSSMNNVIGSIYPLNIIREMAGFYSNPHKAMVIALPLAFLGLAALWHKGKKRFYEFSLLICLMSIGPVVATIIGGYFYVPRQSAASLPIFLYFVAEGVSLLKNRLDGFRVSRFLGLFAVITIGVLPWIKSILFSSPPFPDQPRHVYKKIVNDFLESDHGRLFFVADPCTGLAVLHYMKQMTSSDPTIEIFDMQGVKLTHNCFGLKCELYATDSTLCASSADSYEVGGAHRKTLDTMKNKPDFLIYSNKEFPQTGLRQVRSW